MPRWFRHYWGKVRIRKIDVGTYRYFMRLNRFVGGHRRSPFQVTGLL